MSTNLGYQLAHAEIDRVESELNQLRADLAAARRERDEWDARWDKKCKRLESERDDTRRTVERLRKAVAPLLTEVTNLRDGLLRSKRAIAPDSDTLHWEGISPRDLEPSEGDKYLAKHWDKVIQPVVKALNTTTPSAEPVVNHPPAEATVRKK